MELHEQLEKIESLRTDKYMQMLFLGARCLGSLNKIGENMIEKHKSKKNQTINKKLWEFWGDLSGEFDFSLDEFFEPALIEISIFCGMGDVDVQNSFFSDFFFDYSVGGITLDEFIAEVKGFAIAFAESDDE